MKLLLISDEGEVIQSFDDIEKHDATSTRGVLELLDFVESVAEAARSNDTVSRLEHSVARTVAQSGAES